MRVAVGEKCQSPVMDSRHDRFGSAADRTNVRMLFPKRCRCGRNQTDVLSNTRSTSGPAVVRHRRSRHEHDDREHEGIQRGEGIQREESIRRAELIRRGGVFRRGVRARPGSAGRRSGSHVDGAAGGPARGTASSQSAFGSNCSAGRSAEHRGRRAGSAALTRVVAVGLFRRKHRAAPSGELPTVPPTHRSRNRPDPGRERDGCGRRLDGGRSNRGAGHLGPLPGKLGQRPLRCSTRSLRPVR